MDPQQKMLLEAVYEATEAAGYSYHELRGSETAVFLGQMTDDYRDILYHDMDNVSQYTATGASRAITANRISYFFDWRGPSANIDTACSSSLVALHQAVQTLRSGESSLAVAAGVNLILSPEMFIVESKVSGLYWECKCGENTNVRVSLHSFTCFRPLDAAACGMPGRMATLVVKA